MPLILLLEHKNPIFVLERAENGGSEGKSAQNPRFCAQNARKRGFQTPKAHKNGDFVLGLEAGVYYFTREEPLDVVDDAVWR